jgi:hypothetical protein
MFNGSFICQGNEFRFLRHQTSRRLNRLTDFHQTWHKRRNAMRLEETRCVLVIVCNSMADARICELREAVVLLDVALRTVCVGMQNNNMAGGRTSSSALPRMNTCS